MFSVSSEYHYEKAAEVRGSAAVIPVSGITAALLSAAYPEKIGRFNIGAVKILTNVFY